LVDIFWQHISLPLKHNEGDVVHRVGTQKEARQVEKRRRFYVERLGLPADRYAAALNVNRSRTLGILRALNKSAAVSSIQLWLQRGNTGRQELLEEQYRAIGEALCEHLPLQRLELYKLCPTVEAAEGLLPALAGLQGQLESPVLELKDVRHARTLSGTDLFQWVVRFARLRCVVAIAALDTLVR
jgi:hypothetical protein